MKFEILILMIGSTFILFILFSFIFTIPYGISKVEYKTNTIVTCIDGNHNIIEGVTCYEKIDCSNLSWVKWLNDKKCEDYLG